MIHDEHYSTIGRTDINTLLVPTERVTATRSDSPDQLYSKMVTTGGLRNYVMVVLEYVPMAKPNPAKPNFCRDRGSLPSHIEHAYIHAGPPLMCLNSDGLHHSASYVRADHLHADAYNRLHARVRRTLRAVPYLRPTAPPEPATEPPSIYSTRRAITYVYG